MTSTVKTSAVTTKINLKYGIWNEIYGMIVLSSQLGDHAPITIFYAFLPQELVQLKLCCVVSTPTYQLQLFFPNV